MTKRNFTVADYTNATEFVIACDFLAERGSDKKVTKYLNCDNGFMYFSGKTIDRFDAANAAGALKACKKAGFHNAEIIPFIG